MNVERPAGFWIRLAALILDGLIIGVPLSIIGYMFTGDVQTSNDNWVINLISLLYTLLVPVFWYGYTVGKRVCGIRIVKTSGENVGLGSMLLRYIVGYLVYVFTLGIGILVSAIMVGVRKDKRAIHDFIGGTYVTYQKPGEKG
ncbi:RDD family protein [Pseudalkalibacillus caeni]|uniref:RDD family protein n=1 Tax=Exobacillus caeni TaxID=2574798 RepID=A0A5R9F5G7_9BACL|nr:RDD family protein [Pseudalkalibacillus caeni]TLS35724.1 RDD family protein [Pseudalkalibacillus caeni]